MTVVLSRILKVTKCLLSLPVSFINKITARMTDTEIEGPGRHRNGDVLAESATKRDDVFDETYKEKEGPKPSMRIVWKNIILMTLLHIGAVYGISLVPSAHVLTWAWCKYDKANPLVISNELSFTFKLFLWRS